ncbi:hypothetical protein IKJ53_01285 [bacterium]|nr:hypothetical protein [bacterium]
MKKIVSALFIMALGLQANATNIYPLSNLPSQTINGTVERCADRDIIMMNSRMSTYDSIFNTRSAVGAVAGAGLALALLVDPYYVQVDGVNYVMIKDKTSNKWTAQDFLGIEDTKETLFNGLKTVESDGDYTKITSNELKKAKIRFARVDKNGTVLANDRTKDLNLNKIDYIDMTTLQKVANSKIKGIAGHFRLFLKTKDNSRRMVIGYATLDNKDDLQISFK